MDDFCHRDSRGFQMKIAVKKGWSTTDIPDQYGKLAIVTGGTGGLGYETALELARAGAEVILAGRNQAKGVAAIQRIRADVSGAKVRFELIDLGSLESVAKFSERLLKTDRPIDILVNNAGVMALPKRETTKDGFELQFGTNHLAHFALTAQLLPLLRRAVAPRVTTVSSLMHRISADIHFDDLQWTRKYNPNGAYGQSKLANILFALELQRRSDANGWGLMSNAAHPGGSSTDLIANGPGTDTFAGRMSARVVGIIGQSAAQGALPTLYAATSPEAQPGGYYGPANLFEMKGPVTNAKISDKAKNPVLGERLWTVSEQLTNVFWPDSENVPAPADKR